MARHTILERSRTATEDDESVPVRYVCANPAHQARRAGDGPGLLIFHSGTCGWCPGNAPVGAHQWVRRATTGMPGAPSSRARTSAS